MGGGHKKANPHGSPGGKKGPGDVLAENVHGRKGKDKERREKGQFCVNLSTQRQARVIDLTKNEAYLLILLMTLNKYSPNTLSWDELLKDIKATDSSIEPNELIQQLQSKVREWIVYIPYHSIALNYESYDEITTQLRQLTKEESTTDE